MFTASSIYNDASVFGATTNATYSSALVSVGLAVCSLILGEMVRDAIRTCRYTLLCVVRGVYGINVSVLSNMSVKQVRQRNSRELSLARVSMCGAIVMDSYTELRFPRIVASSISVMRLFSLIVNSPSEEGTNYLYHRGVSSSARIYAWFTGTESSGFRSLIVSVTVTRNYTSSHGNGIL